MDRIGKILLFAMAVVLIAASFLIVGPGEADPIEWEVQRVWERGEGDRCGNSTQAKFRSEKGDIVFGCCTDENLTVPRSAREHGQGDIYIRRGNTLFPRDDPNRQPFKIKKPPEQETDTPVPSWTPTSTEIPPTVTSTNTPSTDVPPTATSTEVPPTATSTNTPPPTATPTATLVPTSTNTPIPGHPSGGGNATCDNWSGFVQADENYAATWIFKVVKNDNVFFDESGTLNPGESLPLGEGWRVNKDNVEVVIYFRVEASDGSVAEDNVKKTLNCGKPATPTPPPEIEYPPGAEGFESAALAQARQKTVAGVGLFVLAFAIVTVAIRKS